MRKQRHDPSGHQEKEIRGRAGVKAKSRRERLRRG